MKKLIISCLVILLIIFFCWCCAYLHSIKPVDIRSDIVRTIVYPRDTVFFFNGGSSIIAIKLNAGSFLTNGVVNAVFTITFDSEFLECDVFGIYIDSSSTLRLNGTDCIFHEVNKVSECSDSLSFQVNDVFDIHFGKGRLMKFGDCELKGSILFTDGSQSFFCVPFRVARDH